MFCQLPDEACSAASHSKTDIFHASRAQAVTLKKELDAAEKKEILGLIFKKIIVEDRRNARRRPRVSPVFYEPFGKIAGNSLFLSLEGEKCDVISSKLTAAVWARGYHKLKLVLERIFKDAF